MSEGDQVQSYIRAARAGNLEKIIEYLNAGVDVNAGNPNGLNALHLAAKEGRLEVVKELLKRNARVDQATKKGNTALHIACLAGQLPIVEVLIDRGADVNRQSQNGFTPLYMAAQENHVEVVTHLLQHGANQMIATEDGFTPLAVALQQGNDRVVTLLLENDSRGRVRMPALHIAARKDDVNAINLLLNSSDTHVDHQSANGFTPLHVAAHHGSENAARVLIANGADVNFQAKNNITPLHVAAKLGRVNVLQVLLDNHAEPNAQNRDGLTPLHCAARSGHDKAVEVLLRSGARPDIKTKNGLAPIHNSAQGDYVECSALLVQNNVDINETTLDMLTPLHVAAHCGNLITARYLLNNHCEVDPRALNGFTPLHVAVKKMRIKIVELLLRYQANIHATTETGLTPLHIAAFLGLKDIVLLLLANGAKVDETNLRCETPLHLATRNNQVEVMQILLQHGAEVDAKAMDNLTPLHMASRNGNMDSVQLLLSHQANPNATTKDLTTPLHLAAREGKDDVVDLLLQYQANPHAKTKKGFTPLSMAAKNGRVNAGRRLIQAAGPQTVNDASPLNGLSPLHVAVHFNHPKMVQLLLDKGADVLAKTSNGYTPLHIAAKRGHYEIADMLLMYAANSPSSNTLVRELVHATAVNGCTPLHLAAQEGHTDICSLLLKHGASPDEQATNGVTSLHLAAQGDQIAVGEVLLAEGATLAPLTKAGYTPLHTASHFGRPRMVQFLLGRHHPVNVTTNMGSTPLHLAAQQGHLAVVKLLLEEGHADPNIRNQQNWTPAHVAFIQKQRTIYDLLRTVTTVVESWETEEVEIIEEIIQLEKPDNINEGVTESNYDEPGGAFSPAMKRDHSGRGYPLPGVESTGITSSGDFTLSFMSPDPRYSASNDDIWNQMVYLQKSSAMGGDSWVDTQENRSGEILGPEDSMQQEFMDQRQVGHAPFAVMSPTMKSGRHDGDMWETMNVPIVRKPVSSGFLVSSMVDARGSVLQAQRYPDLRIIVPPNAASGPIRIVCRLVKPHRLNNPVPLHDGNGLACRVLEMGPSQMHFNTPIVLEIPYYASLRGRERELIVFRSDNGETWKEHPMEASDKAVHDAINSLFETPIPSNAELREKRILRILTADLPVYFAVVTRFRQETVLVGKEGGILSSSTVSQVQAVFPPDALLKAIKVGVQAQSMHHELCRQVLESLGLSTQIRFSPVVTIEPRRRKFHRPITITIPSPGNVDPSGKSPDASNVELRLLCSITGGSSTAQWEDITGSSILSRVRDCISFTSTVSARFWLLECPKNSPPTFLEAANRIYVESNRVPYIGRFAVYAKSSPAGSANDGELRALCLIDDHVEKTLECQQDFLLVAQGPNIELINDQFHHVELLDGLKAKVNLLPNRLPQNGVSNGERRVFTPLPVRAFTENRTSSINVNGHHGKVVLWPPAMDVRGEVIGHPGTSPLVTLEVKLPSELGGVDLPKASVKPVVAAGAWNRNMVTCRNWRLAFDDQDSIARSELDVMEVANMVGGDWLLLGRQLGVSDDALRAIQRDESLTCEEAKALEMLTTWQQEAGPRANGNELARCLLTIGRDDVVKTSMHNVAYVTSDREKNEARELLGIDGKPLGRGTPQRMDLLRVNTANSVEDSLFPETGGDDEDALREIESKNLDKGTSEEEPEGRILGNGKSSPTEIVEEDLLVPEIDPRRGVASREPDEVDPETQKSRQEAYLNLIQQMEVVLPAVELAAKSQHDQSEEIEEEVLVAQKPDSWVASSVPDTEMTTVHELSAQHDEPHQDVNEENITPAQVKESEQAPVVASSPNVEESEAVIEKHEGVSVESTPPAASEEPKEASGDDEEDDGEGEGKRRHRHHHHHRKSAKEGEEEDEDDEKAPEAVIEKHEEVPVQSAPPAASEEKKESESASNDEEDDGEGEGKGHHHHRHHHHHEQEEGDEQEEKVAPEATISVESAPPAANEEKKEVEEEEGEGEAHHHHHHHHEKEEGDEQEEEPKKESESQPVSDTQATPASEPGEQ